MKLEAVLNRIGASIVKVEKGDKKITLFLRVDAKRAGLWADTVQEFLLASADQRVTWSTDVSKFFYPVKDTGVVRFLWRIILNTDPKSAAEALGRAAQRAVQQGVEVVSQPLVGRKTFEFDPSRGKIAGAHDLTQAQNLIAQGMAR